MPILALTNGKAQAIFKQRDGLFEPSSRDKENYYSLVDIICSTKEFIR